jgi:hypothetical protein
MKKNKFIFNPATYKPLWLRPMTLLTFEQQHKRIVDNAKVALDLHDDKAEATCYFGEPR